METGTIQDLLKEINLLKSNFQNLEKIDFDQIKKDLDQDDSLLNFDELIIQLNAIICILSSLINSLLNLKNEVDKELIFTLKDYKLQEFNNTDTLS